MKFKVFLFCSFCLFCSLLNSTTWIIDQFGGGNFTTIQEGIIAATDADTVLVYPGTYYENIDFIGKDITVASLLLTTGNENYINSTIIDGNQQGSVVTFENDETNEAILMGFTIKNGSGYDTSPYGSCGGGIFINFSSPSLKYLLIKNNTASAGGGIHFSSTNAILEALTLRDNHAFFSGGGIKIGRLPPDPMNSNITFNYSNKCNIFNNSAGNYSDIFVSENHTPITNVIVDTLTILEPDLNFVSQFSNINLSIEHAWLEQVEHDLYVSPDGDDNNSGLTANEPLKTIQWALTKIKADSLNPRNIYLAEGIYSPNENDQLFPLNLRSYVSIIGTGIDETILEEPVGKAIFVRAFYDNNISISYCSFRNRTGENLINTALSFLNNSYIKLFDIKIENCESNSRSSISSADMNIELNNVQIINNRGFSSVGIYTDNPENYAIINNCIFIGNDQYEPTCGGGALHIVRMKNVNITNCLFAKNHAYDNMWPQANIYLLENDTVDFFNNIVYNNSSNGGAISLGQGGTINIKNSIISGNSSPYLFLTSRGDEPTYVNISHSLIQGGTDPSILHFAGPEPYGVEFIWGEGIIDDIPQFLGGDEYDPLYYQLTELSPCVDSGTPDTTGLFLPPWDLLHNYRVWDGDGNGVSIIDMGCYEFGAEQYVEAENIQSSIFNIQLSNYPNPFNPETKIVFNLPVEGNVKLEIYNIKGQKVKTLMDCYTSPGDFELIWNGRDDNNLKVGSGIYFYQLKVNGNSEAVKKCLLLK